MNKRRLSYGLLLTLAGVAGAMLVACGDPEPVVPPQPSAATAEPPPPPPAEPPPPPAETAKPEPPPPPPKMSKELFAGKFSQDFSGDVKAAVEAAFDKSPAAKKDSDGSKKKAALEKGAKMADMGLEVSADQFVWTVKGKAAHTVTYKVEKGDDPKVLVLKLGKDGKKDLKGKELKINFDGETTLSFEDPFTAKNPKVYVFKK